MNHLKKNKNHSNDHFLPYSFIWAAYDVNVIAGYNRPSFVVEYNIESFVS